MSKQTIMLLETIKFIKETENIDNQKAFNKLLQWCGLQLGVTGALFKSKIETYEYLTKRFDIDSLKEESHDWLGELYTTIYGKSSINKKFLIEHKASSKLADKIIKQSNCNEPLELYLDCEVGTGRTLISIYKKMKGKVILYGIEKDKTLYRVCLVNFALHDVKAKIICWNEDVCIGTIIPNDEAWKKSNDWNK